MPANTLPNGGGKNATSFSSTNQPKTKNGRKKVSGVRKLMREFGRSLAPQDIRNDETVSHFLTQNGMKGTVHEVLIARLYALAIYGGNIKAFELIMNFLDGKTDGAKNSLNITFVAPPALTQEKEIDLTSDEWTITKPGESSTSGQN